MAYLKITLELEGNRLNYTNLLSDLKEKYFLVDKIQKGNKFSYIENDYYKISCIWILNPEKYVEIDNNIEYQEWYLFFIAMNYERFLEYGVNNINLFFDVYVQYNEQCNFEIFDKEILKKLSQYNVSLPISIHVLKEEEMKNFDLNIV